VVQLVEYRTRNQEVVGSTHTRSTASNLEQVANILCAQANSASYHQWDGKWVVATATGWRPSVADWSNGVSASCIMGPMSVSAGNGWHIMRCGTIGSCQLAATSEIVKALLVTSLTHVSGAIASVQTFTFTTVLLYWLNSLLGLRIMKCSKSDRDRMPWIRLSSSTTTSRCTWHITTHH